MMNWRTAYFVVIALSLAGCLPQGTEPRQGVEVISQSEIYTLYREASTPDRSRIHIATFDAAENGTYNRENCFTAAEHFGRDAAVRFWCEQGRFKR